MTSTHIFILYCIVYYIKIYIIQCAARLTRHRAASLFRGTWFSGHMMTKFSWKKGNLSPHFFMIFEYFGCLGARPGGLGHILSPRLGFLWFLRFARCEKLPPFGPKNDQKSFKNRSQTQQVFRSLFWSTLERSWDRFGRILGGKMEPKLIQNRSQERSWRKFKNH